MSKETSNIIEVHIARWIGAGKKANMQAQEASASQAQQIFSLINSNKIVVVIRNETGPRRHTGQTSRNESTKATLNSSSRTRLVVTDLDVMHLFELYGIDMSKVRVLNVQEMPGEVNECEKILTERFLEGYMMLKVTHS